MVATAVVATASNAAANAWLVSRPVSSPALCNNSIVVVIVNACANALLFIFAATAEASPATTTKSCESLARCLQQQQYCTT